MAISTGGFHTCAIKTNGRAECWGLDDSGRATPPTPNGPFVAISTGGFHNCAINTSDNAQCWGSNTAGRAPPTRDGPFVAIAAGRRHTCAIKTNGEAECWGDNGNARTTVPDGFTARTDPDAVWLGEKTQSIGGDILIKAKVYLEGALP